MAWQSPSGLVGNGAAAGGGGDGQSNGGQPHGTEYTLQGVMRFLHTEWHRHERDRNAWEIERAEMKARIAKLEGEHRTNKKLQESYSRQIQMLENVIKKERENFKAAVSGDSLASVPAKEPKGKEKEKEHPETKGLDAGGERPPAPKPHNSFLEVEDSPEGVPPFQGDVERHKSNGFLEKCIHEVTYLLTPPIHPAPQPLQHNPQDLGQGFPGVQQPSMEELYARRQQSQQQGIGLSQPSPSPNHQPPPVPGMNASFPQNQHHQSMRMQRSLAEQHPISQFPAASNFDRPQPQPGLMSAPEEPVEKVVHSFDSYGRQIPARTAEGNIPTHILAEEPPPDPDGWNFDDTSPVPIEPSEVAQSQRRDTDVFPSADQSSAKSPTRTSLSLHRRKSSNPRRRSDGAHELREIAASQLKSDSTTFKVKFALRGHLDVVRSVIFTGGGSPSEPEICTTGDDGVIKRWIIPATYGSYGSHGAGMNNDLDIQSYFTHRGHQGVVTSLAACPAPQNFSSGGRAIGDGWIFSGGQDATVRVWERGRVDPKATLDGHTDAVWSVCVLPATSLSVFGADSNNYGGPDRILLASGSADGTVKIWAVSAPPQLSSPHSGSRRGVGGSRRHSVSSGSNFPSSPQPSTASATPFNYTLIHTISRPDISASPTCIAPLAMTGENFVVSYTDASVLIFDTRTGEEIVGMASLETSDSTPATAVNAVVATTVGLETSSSESGRSVSEDDPVVHGATGSRESGIEGVVISGHEDRYIRFFDANSGQCTYTMLAHPSSISSLSPSPDGRELVSAGHDASLRFWSLEKRSCTQEITSHRLMRGEGVCSVVWSQDGRWVVSGGGDGVVKVFARS